MATKKGSHSRLNIYFIIVNAMADFVKFLWSLWKTLTLNKKYVNNSYPKGIYYKLKYISIRCMMKIKT